MRRRQNREGAPGPRKRTPRTPEGFAWPDLDQTATVPVDQSADDMPAATPAQSDRPTAFADVTFSSPPAPAAPTPPAAAAELALDASTGETRSRRPRVAVLAVSGALVAVVAGGVGVASSMGLFDRGNDTDTAVTPSSSPKPVVVTTGPDRGAQSGRTTRPQSPGATPSVDTPAADTTGTDTATQDEQVQQVGQMVYDPGQAWQDVASQDTTGTQQGTGTPQSPQNPGSSGSGTTQGNHPSPGNPQPSRPTTPDSPAPQDSPSAGDGGSGEQPTTPVTGPTDQPPTDGGATDPTAGSTDTGD